jgi:hypothetical protein
MADKEIKKTEEENVVDIEVKDDEKKEVKKENKKEIKYKYSIETKEEIKNRLN